MSKQGTKFEEFVAGIARLLKYGEELGPDEAVVSAEELLNSLIDRARELTGEQPNTETP